MEAGFSFPSPGNPGEGREGVLVERIVHTRVSPYVHGISHFSLPKENRPRAATPRFQARLRVSVPPWVNPFIQFDSLLPTPTPDSESPRLSATSLSGY